MILLKNLKNRLKNKLKMNLLEEIYNKLKRKYKKNQKQWEIWCKRKKTKKEREEIIIGSILTQRTNWNNVEKAMENLKKAKINSLEKIYKLGRKKLSLLIKPAGFYKTKANYLFNLAKFIIKNYGNIEKMKKEKTEILREKLLKLKGIGPETADSILLYALDKPIFVIDEYTKRLVKKYKLTKNFSYSFLQKLFQENLPQDLNLYQNFHALIVIDGKTCKEF